MQRSALVANKEVGGSVRCINTSDCWQCFVNKERVANEAGDSARGRDSRANSSQIICLMWDAGCKRQVELQVPRKLRVCELPKYPN